jgi:hypothetical protein
MCTEFPQSQASEVDPFQDKEPDLEGGREFLRWFLLAL